MDEKIEAVRKAINMARTMEYPGLTHYLGKEGSFELFGDEQGNVLAWIHEDDFEDIKELVD